MKIVFCYPLFLILILLSFSTCSAQEEIDFTRLREAMVNRQIMDRGVNDPDVIKAMRKVPRHLFVPQENRRFSYADHPLPIGEGQTISQPYIVAFMTEVLKLKPGERVLEIGTGSGYQAAVLAEIINEVYSIEIIQALGESARETLGALGYKNVHIKIGDGHKGWPQKAPFDAIIVTCAPEKIPRPLVEQLKEGGRMIIPVGRRGTVQKLVRAVKRGGQLKTEDVMLVRFVPMVTP
ncbi:MAG: protein-L-isoaspartate(D-aspartate) O-methyltransferase [Desulfobacteraceae bacterium]|uniref:Protein-L-isoaspartate O-methyltransferase n=1 Tax=Candidatus Desulfacyla euxinica TaxID=2841693 RepID=A0A8J6T6N8_9DELT|nr:protein-L-isoaspartate(D-aspartate) O-methyltransferase [Candidatus Desulfacyla euxinica]MBL6977376.1 protein-L-isoaspartate(D-aspartate) O-methyltransferase [Desulfobacteraceae bacterium]MBL7216631.1 protein-L-isoaspartate(D-aspartate) O-methyltransferase [Desulfobacteraceae bacterium]